MSKNQKECPYCHRLFSSRGMHLHIASCEANHNHNKVPILGSSQERFLCPGCQYPIEFVCGVSGGGGRGKALGTLQCTNKYCYSREPGMTLKGIMDEGDWIRVLSRLRTKCLLDQEHQPQPKSFWQHLSAVVDDF